MGPLKRARLLIIIPWKESGKWELPHDLGRYLGKVGILQPVLTADPRSRILKGISIRASEFYLPFLAMRKGRIDLVLSWTMRIGILFGILRRVFRTLPRGRHILCDFHIDPTRSDPIYKLRLKMLEMALPGIDFFYCTSNEERELYCKSFCIPLERIRFFPLAPAGHLFRHAAQGDGAYIFSYGNSDRDFETLIRAVAELRVDLILLSQLFRPRGVLPHNVRLIERKLPYAELLELIQAAQVVVLPLRSSRVSAGQMAMMEVMAMGAPLVVSRNMATQEYASHGETALFFESGNEDDLKKQVRCLLENPNAARRMGRSASEAAKGFRRKQLHALLEGLEETLAKDLRH
jgi:glycosyltransferase involved in cell wall biosynthesis